MDEQDFITYLEDNKTRFEYSRGEHNGVFGVFVLNKRFDTEIHISYETVKAKELNALLLATHCGRNVEQITRVTGFMSKVSGWNKGKTAELKDRFRNDISKTSK